MMTPHGAGASRDRWLVSYADFMTLLFAFFATMYAISSVDARKLTKVAHALQVAFDDSAKGRSIAAGTGLLPERGTRLVGGADEPGAREIIGRDLAADIQAGRVEVIHDPRGLVLSIPESGVFATGSDELSPAARQLIRQIGATLSGLPNDIRVEGHTDDLPIHTARFRSNWDLSTARATRVIEFLTEDAGLDGRRLSAAGYAQFQPRADNASADDRARNRRVDLVILDSSPSAANR